MNLSLIIPKATKSVDHIKINGYQLVNLDIIIRELRKV